MLTKEKPKYICSQETKTTSSKESIVKELYGDNVIVFTKSNGLTFWIYEDVLTAYNLLDSTIVIMKNKIAAKAQKYKKEHPEITDYFIAVDHKSGSNIVWEYYEIDLNSYTPKKSKKDECIDELNDLIGDKK